MVASPTKVVWATPGGALNLLLAGGPGPDAHADEGPTPTRAAPPAPTASPGTSPLPADVQALVRYANDRFEAAQAALQRGDFATYGAEMAEVEKALRQLEALTGGSPSPAP